MITNDSCVGEDDYCYCRDSNEPLYVFKHVMKHIDDLDDCTTEDLSELSVLFDKYLDLDIKELYVKQRQIPMISWNHTVYTVNDYQYILKSEPDFRYVIHTNFLITNCGYDKWSRHLDDDNVTVQFYKVPIEIPVDDLWIDDDHIPRTISGVDRRDSLAEFIQILTRQGDQAAQDGSYVRWLNLDDSWDDNDDYDQTYRHALDFPPYPKVGMKLEPKLLRYSTYSCHIDSLKDLFETISPAERVQCILCFRTSIQVTSGK